MIEEINIEKALEYLRLNAEPAAEARATRLYLEQYRKSLKALLMNKVEGAEHIRTSYAYSNTEYITLLESYKDAVKDDEYHRWMMTAAQTKVEVWRSQNANNRFIDKSHT